MTPESLFSRTVVSSKLNYLRANKIAEGFYQKVLNAHAGDRKLVCEGCLVFCFSHLSTTVNLSICNNWLSIFNNIYLIPKKGSLNSDLLMHISDPTRLMKSRARESFGETIMEIKGIMAETALPVIIFDIGGYFAPYVDELSVLLGRRLILVLEDTANGHEKYRNTDYFGRSNRFKSVAYDSYKMAENVMVANVILSHLPSYVQGWSEYKAVLVVGYGRIGRSLCFGLKRQGFKRIVVVDSDRGRLFMAATEEFEVLTPLELRSCRDIFHYCFSMSGQHGTNKVVVNAMCENGYICVVTSYDDEFDSELIKIYESGDTSKVHVDGKKINIVNGGRPINLSVCAAFDARNLSLHFIFGRILSSFLVSLGMKSSGSWEEEAFFDMLSEIR